MTFNTNHLLRRTSYEMQTLSNAGKLIETMKAKMKEHNIDSVELSFTVLKGNAIQFHDAFECFCTLILNKSNFNQCERRRGILPKRMIWHENGKYFKKFINLHKIFLGVSNNSLV